MSIWCLKACKIQSEFESESFKDDHDTAEAALTLDLKHSK